jgi:glutathione synthase/RimK-type ligase-like ATP-grasp enzyme
VKGFFVDNFIVVVDKLDDWRPYYPTDQVVAVKDYLFNPKYQEIEGMQVINLCHKTKYMSQGYYCSLLAEARKHKATPNLKTLNDLSKKKLYISDLDDLQLVADSMTSRWAKIKEDVKVISFRIYFGRTRISEFQELAREIFEYYPCPILEARLVHKGVWQIGSLVTVGIRDLNESEEDFFAESLDLFSNKIWRLPKIRKSYNYDLAILHEPTEALPPSNAEALKKFHEACERNAVFCEMITKRSLTRISEYDALFIRTTTSITNYTYRFSKIATDEGLVVVDDPVSILECSNKIFLSNLLDRIQVPGIPGRFVSDTKAETLDDVIARFGLPLVVKIPDGSFSIGVKKVENKEALKEVLEEMLKKSDLILVQKFLYTEYDWRVGVLGGEALYACKYFMSKSHWQIYNHALGKEDNEFSGNHMTVSVKEVPAKVLEMAIRSASAIGNGLYGVDLKEDKDGNVYVVEVNDNPNIDCGVEDQVLGDQLYDKIIKWFVKEIKKKKSAKAQKAI